MSAENIRDLIELGRIAIGAFFMVAIVWILFR
jgi:hypothetical protein